MLEGGCRTAPVGRPVDINWCPSERSSLEQRNTGNRSEPWRVSAPPGDLKGRAWKVPRAGGSSLGKTLVLKETEALQGVVLWWLSDGGKERNTRLRARVLQRQGVTKESEQTGQAPRSDRVRKQDLTALGAGCRTRKQASCPPHPCSPQNHT